MKTVVITGASRGIGKALCAAFLDTGHRVIALARNEKALQEIEHTHYEYIAIDLYDLEKINIELELLKNTSIDILINNAGILINKSFSELSLEDFETSLKINYLAPIQLIKILEKSFTNHAHIVNISTIGAVQGSQKFPTLSAYGGSKAALCHLTEILAEEWKNKNIAINCLALGAVQTEMLANAFPNYKAEISAEQIATYIKNFALEGNQFYNGKILQVSNSTP